MESRLAAVKTFTASAAKADASARSSIQQSSRQILGRLDGGSSRLAFSAKAVRATAVRPSPLLTFTCVVWGCYLHKVAELEKHVVINLACSRRKILKRNSI